MKKLLSLFVIALFLIGLCEIGQAADSYERVHGSGLQQSPGVGVIEGAGQSLGTPIKKFRVVRFYYHTTTSGSGVGTSGAGVGDYTLSPDSLMVWDNSTSGDDGVTVTTSGTSRDALIAGVMVSGISWLSSDGHGSLANIIATVDAKGRTDNWGFMQTSGLCYVRYTGAITTGYPIATSAIHGVCAMFAPGGPLSGDCGVALNAVTAASTGALRVKVMLKGLE